MATYPFYIRATVVMLIVLLSTAALYFGRPLIVPLLLALALACLVLPLVRRLESWHCPRGWASLVGTLSVLAGAAVMLGFVWWQLRQFWGDFDHAALLVEQQYTVVGDYLSAHTPLPVSRSAEWLEQQKMQFLNMVVQQVFGFFGTAEMAVTRIILVPLLMFFMLTYRRRLPIFVGQLQPESGKSTLLLCHRLSGLSQQYMRGVLIVMAIVWALSSVGFSLIGLKYPLLAGLVLALLNIVPYVGFLLGAVFPLLIALSQMHDPGLALGVLGIAVLIHILDVSVLTPKIIGSCLSLNPLVSILAMLGGSLLWGLPGLLLSVLLAGVVKTIFDHVAVLRPFGYLMGEEKKLAECAPPSNALILPDK